MKRLYISAVLAMCASACTQKPKPVSKDIHKTAVVVNGKKDSVINNPQKNYGNATVSSACTKTVLTNIQATDSYKRITLGIPAIKYVINWVNAENPLNRSTGGKITNGLQVVIKNNDKKIATYVYSNEDGKLYFVNENDQYSQIAIDTNALKQIRNGCYWGVASNK